MTYLKIAKIVVPLLVLAGLIGAILWYRGDAAEARTDLVTMTAERDDLKKANEAYDLILKDLREANDANDRLIEQLSADNVAIARRAVEARNERRQIKRTEPDAKTHLDTPIPDSLRGMLDRRYGDAAGEGGGAPAD